ncbi:MFS transporter [Streptomyces sp. NPDC005808]|uniref:MFS transporter n=1 Tax=Streptomyces sp. NPDC005808 TaxID=3364734 RepID=UPI00368A9AA1
MSARPRVTARIALLASISATFLATSSAPTPLYDVYSQRWGVSAAAISVVFGAYALALLLALLVLGRVSDHIGRRAVIFPSLVVQVVAMLVFAGAGGVDGLLVGRVLQGLSTGAGLAAVGAALLDVDAERGRIANSAAPALGSAVGALASAVLVTFAPMPTRLVYLVFAIVLVLQIVALSRLPETAPRTPGAVRSLRPRLRAPRRVRALLGAAVPVLFAVWAVSGLFGAFGPHLAAQLTGSSSPILGALPIAIVGAVAPVVAFSTTGLAGRRSLAYGITGLLTALAITAVALLSDQMWILLAGSVVAGAGFGFGFRGGMDLVLPAVDESERADTLSLLYIASYLGFGVPAIVAGIVLQGTGNLTATTLGYAAVLAVLAATAACVLRLTGDNEGTNP